MLNDAEWAKRKLPRRILVSIFSAKFNALSFSNFRDVTLEKAQEVKLSCAELSTNMGNLNYNFTHYYLRHELE